jgi:hypothetical protein
MGTWGIGLYDSDDALDLREDFKAVVRAPWDGDRLLGWALEAFPAAADPGDSTYSDLRLALADLFWLYGIEHSGVRDDALRLVSSGADIETKRALGMSDRDLARRARVLRRLSEKWSAANPKPRPRRIHEQPEQFVLEVGDCFAYPTAVGRVRNPYVSPAREKWFYERYPWKQDGWAAAIVLTRNHRFETFARYLVALLRYDEPARPDLALVPSLDVLHSKTFMPNPLRRVHLVHTKALHLRRMRVEMLGKLAVNEPRVRAAFAGELATAGREFANDAWTLPDMYEHRPQLLAPANVPDPIRAFLV